MCARLIAVDTVRPLIPDALKIFSVLPGRTLQTCYVARYGDGSTLRYHELIVVAGLVRHRGRIGAWVSDIFVDCSASRDGGRGIWSLPKQLAGFHWRDEDGRITVQVEGDTGVRCSLTAERPRSRLTLPLWAPVLSLDSNGPLAFAGRGRAGFSVGAGLLNTWQGCPFSAFSATDSDQRRVIFFDQLRLEISEPHAV